MTIIRTVEFLSDGVLLRGNMYLPPHFKEKTTYPLVICTGSWTTVKEQMAGLYAARLAQKGYLCLAFDFRGYGSSKGVPRFYECPMMKIEDLKQAVHFALTLPEVDPSSIYMLGICAGSGYTADAACQLTQIKKMALVAPWLQDKEATNAIYGGSDAVQERIKAAQEAKQYFIDNDIIRYVPTISTSDPKAAMYGSYDYYLNPKRGGIPEWSLNFAVMSWEDWLTYEPLLHASKVNVPTLIIHSQGAVLPAQAKQYFEAIPIKDKKIIWYPTELASPMHQFYFYDQMKEVDFAIQQITDFFKS